MKSLLWTFILIVIFPTFAWGRVRTVEVKQDQIASVKTALGVATIIQVPDRPNSIVVGDQGAFKVEYLDQAITIKPLRGGARSNLYIYTDYRRFNVQLVTTTEAEADYVVYLESPKEKITSTALVWTNFRNHLKNDSLILETKRVAKTRDGVLLVEFEIRSEKRETLKPEWFWLTQSRITRPIHNLALSGGELGSDRVVKGILQILRDDVSDKESLRLELRRKKLSFLTLPKVAAWK